MPIFIDMIRRNVQTSNFKLQAYKPYYYGHQRAVIAINAISSNGTLFYQYLSVVWISATVRLQMPVVFSILNIALSYKVHLCSFVHGLQLVAVAEKS